MKIAVDTCIGRVGANLLRAAGHVVVVTAAEGERDDEWFARALAAGAEFIISTDRDLQILCYDNRVSFFRARKGHSGRVTVERLIQRIAAKGAPAP
jgi:predicted nuclease of predicted toxin-antitoxin system